MDKVDDKPTLPTLPPLPTRLPTKLQLYADLIRWDRPAGWLLLLWPTLSALVLASHGLPSLHLVLVFTLGTILMRSAGCCVNDVADREFDRHVKRTAQRPVTTGQISVKEALGVGAVLALAAFGLVLTTNALTIAWSFVALGVAIAYPFAKRYFSVPQAVLGVAFSFGIPMAFAATQGRVPALAWWLLVGNLCWVMAYDTVYAMVDRDDDVRLGLHTSAIAFGRFDVFAVMLLNIAYLAMWLVVVLDRSLSGVAWAGVGVACAAMLAHLLWQARGIRLREREACFAVFKASHGLGLLMLFAVVAARM